MYSRNAGRWSVAIPTVLPSITAGPEPTTPTVFWAYAAMGALKAATVAMANTCFRMLCSFALMHAGPRRPQTDPIHRWQHRSPEKIFGQRVVSDEVSDEFSERREPVEVKSVSCRGTREGG